MNKGRSILISMRISTAIHRYMPVSNYESSCFIEMSMLAANDYLDSYDLIVLQ